MKQSKIVFTVVLTVVAALPLFATVQSSVAVLAGAELTKVVPAAFYFQGQSAPTQMRNAAAARSGTNRYVIAGMVDTSGYSTEVRAKYEGFFITDSPVTLGGSDVAVGAYGFGFSNDGKLNLLDLGGNQILSVPTTKDSALRRPRPLMMTKAGEEIRFYSGRDYAVIAFK
jgi:hypothetical protein